MSTTAEAPPQREPVKCALPNCPVRFVPKSKDHKFCSNTCKKRSFNYRHVLGRR